MNASSLSSSRYYTSFCMFRSSLAQHQVSHDCTRQLNNAFCCGGKRLATVLCVREFLLNARNVEFEKKSDIRSFVCWLPLTFSKSCGGFKPDGRFVPTEAGRTKTLRWIEILMRELHTTKAWIRSLFLCSIQHNA